MFLPARRVISESWGAPSEPVKAKRGGAATVVKTGDMAPPKVAYPCKPGDCPFAGQSLTVIVSNGIISLSIPELKGKFEAATGARLNIMQVPFNENFENFLSDVINHVGKYDASIAGAWWLGALVAGDYIILYDKYYNDPRFPKWNIDEVLPAPRNLLSHSGKKYMVANDHDGQIMYYRRDPLAEQHHAAFRQQYGYLLDVHLAEAAAGQLSPAAALKAAAVNFEEITIRLGRERQRRTYRASLGF